MSSSKQGENAKPSKEPKVDKKEFDEVMKIVNLTLDKVFKFMEVTSDFHSRQQSREASNVRVEQLMKFMKFKPPPFKGRDDALEPYDWIVDLEKIFEVLNISEEYRVPFAVFMLKGDAYNWWKMERRDEDKDENLPWDDFRGIYFQRYFPETARRKKISMFIHLEQGTMTVSEYSDDFNHYARFAKHIIPDDYATARKFEEGLRLDIRSRVAPLMLETYVDVLRAARTVEHEFEEHERLHGQRKRHRDGNDKACFYCGSADHLVRNCPHQNDRRESLSVDSDRGQLI